MGERLKKLGWYSRIEIVNEYPLERVFETIDKAISDFEREKDTLLRNPYRKITYYCPKCYWFIIDLPREWDIKEGCGYCGSKLEYVNREFLEEYSKLLREYSVKVKPLIRELYNMLGKCNGFQITNYSEIWLYFENEFTHTSEIYLSPVKDTIHILAWLNRLDTSRLDIVDKLENLVKEYSLVGEIKLWGFSNRVESLIAKGYTEKKVIDVYHYDKEFRV
jgi:hypothetical protein